MASCHRAMVERTKGRRPKNRPSDTKGRRPKNRPAKGGTLEATWVRGEGTREPWRRGATDFLQVVAATACATVNKFQADTLLGRWDRLLSRWVTPPQELHYWAVGTWSIISHLDPDEYVAKHLPALGAHGPYSVFTEVKVEVTFKGEHYRYCAVWYSQECCRGRHWPSVLREVEFLHKACPCRRSSPKKLRHCFVRHSMCGRAMTFLRNKQIDR